MNNSYKECILVEKVAKFGAGLVDEFQFALKVFQQFLGIFQCFVKVIAGFLFPACQVFPFRADDRFLF